MSFVNRLEKFSNPNIRPLWRQAWAAKEDALHIQITRTTESLKEHSRLLRPLAIGEVFLQNQQWTSPKKWDRSGIVVEALGHDQYHGSGCLTLRNRHFLRAYTLSTPSIQQQPKTMPPCATDHHCRPDEPSTCLSMTLPQYKDIPPDKDHLPVADTPLDTPNAIVTPSKEPLVPQLLAPSSSQPKVKNSDNL